MNDVAVFVGPGDFFVTQLDLLKVVMLLERRILDVVHNRIHFHHFDVLEFGVEVLNFLTASLILYHLNSADFRV